MGGPATYRKGYENAHPLTFTCPICNNRTSIYVFLNAPANQSANIWGLSISEETRYFEGCTISPSINEHQLKRNANGTDTKCPMHITVTNGNVTIH